MLPLGGGWVAPMWLNRLRNQRGYLTIVTAFMAVPALLAIVSIYDAGILMVGRTGAYDTAYAAASLLSSQRFNQSTVHVAVCDARFFPQHLENVLNQVDWSPFKVESVTSENGGKRLKVEMSVLVDRPFYGERRVKGVAWVDTVSVFATTGPDAVC